jgi:hypothetical protein
MSTQHGALRVEDFNLCKRSDNRVLATSRSA